MSLGKDQRAVRMGVSGDEALATRVNDQRSSGEPDSVPIAQVVDERMLVC